MRPTRIAILVLFFFACLFLFCRSITSGRKSSPSDRPIASGGPLAPPTKSGFRSLFSFSTPFTLFPPNAVISLTDDNSTSFQARPAAFGPPLPHKGLSGQLWIGSGFADDNLPDSEGEGELGCSDVPGWEDGTAGLAAAIIPAKKAYPKGSKLLAPSHAKSKNSKREADSKAVHHQSRLDEGASQPSSSAKYRPFDDGTDDYLHQGLQRPSAVSRKEIPPSGTTHADIQSIQEAAEITGKVALLSRGGCGFLEKVKWAQRRGAVAVIVGDNTKGGPLIQMFARGDTSNVTIPAIFTSRMTATILSSLVQPGSFIEDILDENGNAVVKVQQSDKGRVHRKIGGQGPAASVVGMRGSSAQNVKVRFPRKPTAQVSETSTSSTQARSRGWFSRLFHWGSGSDRVSDKNWVLVDDWSDEKDTAIRNSMEKASKQGHVGAGAREDDDFVIGVQDWRDPDLVGTPSQRKESSSGHSKDQGGQAGVGPRPAVDQKNGKPTGAGKAKSDGASSSEKTDPGSGSQGGLVTKIFGDDDGADFSKSESHSGKALPAGNAAESPGSEGREGLWVTITPTSSASPFFDTLLVLVVSPLITLSVVYALLILRARIRRRRWRAPKSVIERLPVRTYHTVASSTAQSSRIPSPTSSSPTTPLLQHQPQTSVPQPQAIQTQTQPQAPQTQQQASPSRLRPRSRTTTDVPDTGSSSLLRVDSDLQAPRSSSRPEHEKSAPHRPSQWKKYMGRQVECVVCLEEYVDGVSRVMSLPCGHEFHVECITPWLTTRRRTCPICKGDVVRSLARGSPSSPRYEAYRDDSDDDDAEAESSGSGSSSNGAASPERDSDLERGVLVPPGSQRAPRSNRADGWLSLLSSSLGVVTSTRSRRDSQEDRRNR
ncbi:hypothetical protein RB595_005065 [Gaeumannomyces hyphopodioides]